MASLPPTHFRASPFRSPTRSASGVALVIVLAFLVLLSGLVVAFFITTTTDVVSSRNYSQETTAKELSDAAVNLVTSQIKDATAGVSTTGGTLAWASQPGMIRTWDDSGTFYKAFKLYSSDQLVSGTDFDPTADYTALSTWNTGALTKPYNALYADLNSPVKDVAGTLHYPIMDPSGDTGTASAGPTGTSTGIEGFHITPLPGAVGGAAGPGNNPAPMPVKWLYVLQDGTMAPTATGAVSGTQVAVGTSKSNTPTTANPIVGRVAFWADDDTCKVNLNTASEGIYWDMPHTQTFDDHGSADTRVCSQ